MGKLKSKDFYPDFHVNIRKDGRVNGVKPVTLKDIGLPYDLDYAEQTIADLSKEQYENLVEEFIFLIDELLPRDIQDLFYKATLDPRRAYWKLFEEAARRMQLPYYLNCHRDEAKGTVYPNISAGIEAFLYEGRTLADIYLNTCVTREMIFDTIDYSYLLDDYLDDPRISLLFPVEMALFRASMYNYKRHVEVPGCIRPADLAIYDQSDKLKMVVMALGTIVDVDDFLDEDVYDEELRKRTEAMRDEITQVEKYCDEHGVAFLQFSEYQAAGLLDDGRLITLIKESIKDPEYAKAFILHGFEDDEDLADMEDIEDDMRFTDGYIFEGTLKKIKINSDNVCYGPCPEPDDETEQHLTINSEGGVWITRKSFGNGEIEKTNFKVDVEKVKNLFRTIEVRFSRAHEIPFVTDIGSWDMTLTNEEGKEFKYSGPLCEMEETVIGGLSDIVRTIVGREDLFVFDGNPDKITDLKLEYSQKTKIKPKALPEDADYEYITWDYSEVLTIDRATETLTNHIQFAEAASLTNTYHIEAGISNLLDGMWPEMFDDIPGSPEDAIDDPLRQRNYKLTVHTKHGLEKIVEGSYDKDSLPEEWPDFIDKIYSFISFYGIGEIFEEDYYDKPKRRKSDYIFCDVEFESGGKTYCYIADDDSYEVNDTVLVPAGQDDHEALVRIVAKNYNSAENAPFPVEKAKHIIKRVDEDEIEDY